MIAARDFAMLRKTFIGWHPADLAELFSDVGEGDKVVLFKLLPRELAANTFAYLCAARQKHLLKAMGQQEMARLLSLMSDDDRTTLLERLPGNLAASLIQLLTPDERSVSQALLNFPEDSVGRLMTPEFLAFQKNGLPNRSSITSVRTVRIRKQSMLFKPAALRNPRTYSAR